MRTFRRPVVLLATGVALMLPLAACGDDDDDESGDTETPTEAGFGGSSQRTITITETDFALAPPDPVVQAGTTVTFDVQNAGNTPHNLEVEGPEGESELPEDLPPGGSGTLRVEFPEAGSYVMYCPVGNHREQGMEGTVTVE